MTATSAKKACYETAEPIVSKLIPMLQETQQKHGYLPKEDMQRIAKELDMPLTRVYGVATFYAQFRFTPLGKHVVKICHGTACHVNGAENISQAITEDVSVQEGETTPDGLITLERVACLGCCSLAPVIMVKDTAFGRLTPDKAREIMGRVKKGEIQ